MDRRIGIEDAAEIAVDRRAALLSREEAEEILVQRRIEGREAGAEGPVEFGAGAEEGGAQHDAEHPLGVGLGIGEGERCAPRTADHQPVLDAQMFTDPLHVGDEVRGGVGLAGAGRGGAAGAALVEQYGAEAARVEQLAMRRLAAAAGAAMQVDRRDAVCRADGFDVELVAVADGEAECGEGGGGEVVHWLVLVGYISVVVAATAGRCDRLPPP